ncbi:MAG TPA: ATP-binding protein [Kofleriaceae bacterium]|nr:ATP-binding protein [Kofleriaceae bacterium]
MFGAAFTIVYVSFKSTVLPMFAGLLDAKTSSLVSSAATELDVGLGTADRAMLDKAAASVQKHSDFAAIVVRDAHDRIVLVRGDVPDHGLFLGAPYMSYEHGRQISAWAPVTLEGLKLGSVAVVLSTARLDTLDRWAQRLAFGVIAMWLFVLINSVAFARKFVAPIYSMMEFTRKVAGGALAERMTTRAPGELDDLREYLNQMTADLEYRELERQGAQAKAVEMQRELLSLSRMAGMAEIATGVLHNVGNVLNSLNVSVTVVGDQLRGSRVKGLNKSVELFAAHPGGLPAFLATPKGKLLPEYFASVSKQLADENGRLLDELGSISRNVQHLKAIVATQQNYTRATGIVEDVGVEELVDEALRMGESSFAKHGIEIHRDYAPGVRVCTDRHKLLQILVNVVSNARHAVTGVDKPRVIATIATTEAGVKISIADTGVGIPTEHLAKIFAHGFTTKRDGHGFGLHSSANTARELGGALEVSSDGPGRGAMFTLTLPATSKAAHVIN